MTVIWTRISHLWCRHFHPAPMWPVSGRYQCPVCQKYHPVPWEVRG